MYELICHLFSGERFGETTVGEAGLEAELVVLAAESGGAVVLPFRRGGGAEVVGAMVAVWACVGAVVAVGDCVGAVGAAAEGPGADILEAGVPVHVVHAVMLHIIISLSGTDHLSPAS